MSDSIGRTRYTTLHHARDAADRSAIRVFTAVRALLLLLVLVLAVASLT